jgi:hypothetical protein
VEKQQEKTEKDGKSKVSSRTGQKGLNRANYLSGEN